MEKWIRRGITALLIVISFFLIMFGNIYKIKGSHADLAMYDSQIQGCKEYVNSMWVDHSRDMRINRIESINQHRFSWNDSDGIFKIYDEYMNYLESEPVANVGKVLRGIDIAIFLLSLFLIYKNKRIGPLPYSIMSIVLLIYFFVVENKIGEYITSWVDEFDKMDLRIGLTAGAIISVLLSVLASAAWFVLESGYGHVHTNVHRKRVSTRPKEHRVPRPAGDGRVCGSCGNNLKPGAVFCTACGTKYVEPIKSFCPKCGTEFDSDALFCGECGYRRS